MLVAPRTASVVHLESQVLTDTPPMLAAGATTESATVESAARGTIALGSMRGVKPTPVAIESEELKRHVAVLGGTDSGKTTLALSLLEQLLLQGIPVLLVDRKGDLCRYGDGRLRQSRDIDVRLAQLLDTVDVAVFTPGESRGRPLSITLLPAGLELLPADDRVDACKNAAAALSAMLQLITSRSPSTTLQAAVMFDEEDIYLPATAKPPTKIPLENLLKRARSASISIFLATQSPGDLDYKCRENVRNWLVGLVKEPRAIEKLKPMLAEAKLDASAVLPKQKVGQFFLISESLAVPFAAGRNLLPTEQLSEPEIAAIANGTKKRGP